MSIALNGPTAPPLLLDARRRLWQRLFGQTIREIRQADHCSVEEAAHLSGMEMSEWLAIEDGYVPTDPVRLRSMAAALEIGLDQLTGMVLICDSPWRE